MIKDIIRSRIEEGNLESAIKLLQLITPYSDSVDLMSSQLARLKKSRKEHMYGSKTRELHEKTFTLIGNIILEEINTLPDDLKLLKIKLDHILNTYSIIPDSIGLMNYIVTEEVIKDDLNYISNELSKSQESDNLEIETTIEEKSIEEVKSNINEIVNDLREGYLGIRWTDKFIHWLESSQVRYFSSSVQSFNEQQLSNYYPIINDIRKGNENYEIKGLLFIWLEKYLVGEFNEAYDLLINIREDKGLGNSLFYEFLAVSYVNQTSFEIRIKNILVKGNSKELKRILFYIERINESNFQESGSKTILYICEKIAAIINKVYLNVIHNYFRDGTSKGRSKQREVIKRCLETFFQIIELQEVKQHQDNFLDTFSLFLLELDNVGKFPWISIKNDKLFNTTVFDALSFRSDLWKGIPKKEEYIDTVLAEIKINVAELQKNNRLETQVNKRFLTCCMIAYYNYNDERFIDLMKTLVSGDKLDTEKVKNVYIPNDKNKYDLENFLLEKGLQFDEISDISISNTSILHEADDEKNTPSIDKYYKESIKEGYRNYDISVDYFAKTIILFLNVSFDVLICRYYALEHVGLFNAIACIIIMGIICVYLSFELK